jgi:hypothetical protein
MELNLKTVAWYQRIRSSVSRRSNLVQGLQGGQMKVLIFLGEFVAFALAVISMGVLGMHLDELLFRLAPWSSP